MAMQTLRLENNHPQVAYGPRRSPWRSTQIDDVNGESVNVMSTLVDDVRDATFWMHFRGTGIKFFVGGTGELFTTLDEQEDQRVVRLPVSPGGSPAVEITGLEDKDHQFNIVAHGLIWVDHFILESSTGEGFDLMTLGTKAKSVPENAILIEDTSDKITRLPIASWAYAEDPCYSDYTMLVTSDSGTSLIFTFEGIAVWYFTDFDPFGGARRIFLDNEPPDTLTTELSAGHIFQRLTWSRTDLENGQHNLTIEHADRDGKFMNLDFFRVLLSDGDNSSGTTSSSSSSSVYPSNTSPDSPSSTAVSKKASINVTGIAVGVTLGVLTLAVVVLFLMWRLRKQRKAPPPIYEVSHAKPYRIYAPPAGPPPNHQAERPSLEGNSPPPILPGLQTPTSTLMGLSFSPEPPSTVKSETNVSTPPSWSPPEQPPLSGKYTR